MSSTNMKNDKNLKSKLSRLSRCLEQGYVITKTGQLLHRKVCGVAHGPFPRDWVVHHIDHDKANNMPENLMALPRQLHDSLHAAMRRHRRNFNRAELETALKCWRRARNAGSTAIVIDLGPGTV